MKKCKSCGVELPFVVNKNGIRSYKHKYGYGIDCKCLAKWSLETEEGRKWREKQTAHKMKKKANESKKKERKKTREMKIQLMTTTEYWSKTFQPRLNEIVRLIDDGNGCICTNSTLGKMNAGHYFSVGSNKSLSLNMHNIHLQSEHSNSFKGGEPLKYREGIKRVYGENYLNFMDGLKKCPALNISKIELIEAYDTLLEIRRKFKDSELFMLSPLERIELRNEVNVILNFYPEEFLAYDPNKTY